MLRLRSAVLAAALLLASSPSFAQKAKYSRPQDVKIDVTLSDRVKPVEPKPADPKTRAPGVTSTQVLAAQALGGTIRAQQEAILIQLIRDTPDTDPDKPDLMFR